MCERFYSIPTKDERVLRVVVTGQLDGLPIVMSGGGASSILIYPPWVEDAREKGIRLINYERPGYGKSTPQPGRNVADCADDVVAIARYLGLDRLGIWGGSAGGPHALACAALLPDLVVAAVVFCSTAPYPAEGLDWFAEMGEGNVEEFKAAIEGRDVLEPYVEATIPGMLNADPKGLVQAFQTLLSPPDAAVMTEEMARFNIEMFREAVQDRRDGYIDDGLALVSPWGFELSQIQVPVLLLHGEQDGFVPVSHGRWLAERIPRIEARFYAEDGHLSLSANRVPEAHAWLVEKMI